MLTIQRSKKCYSYLLLLVFLLLLPSLLSGAAKGKILGKITELDTGEPLIGVNIMLVGVLEGNVMKPLTLPLGAATNLDGEFVILNIPPGTYSVRVSMIGYGTKILEGIKVSINRTTTVNLELGVEELMGEEVVVVAKKAAIQKDKTSTIQTFSSEDLVNFNLESVGSAVQLSTGVVEGHFRGGRQGEVAYLIDGLQSGIELNVDAIQEIEIITGTFNAEYGKVMSGIVNTAPKEGGSQFSGQARLLTGNYMTAHDYPGISSSNMFHNKEGRFNLGGTIPFTNNSLHLFVFGKVTDDNGLYYGIDRYRMTDNTHVQNSIPEEQWVDNHSGTNEALPMSQSQSQEVMANLTWNMFQSVKLGLLYQYYDREGQSGYNHSNKYMPERTNWNWSTNNSLTFSINNVLGNSAFHELKLLYGEHNSQSSRFKDPYDSRYVHELLNTDNGGFNSGGNSKGFSFSDTKIYEAKYDLVWQVNIHHEIKIGADYVYNDYGRSNFSLRNKNENTNSQYDIDKYQQYIPGDSTTSADSYVRNPIELSAYIQDKAEFDDLVINFGLRFDWFDPQTIYPTDLRNPGNDIITDRKSDYLEANSQYQFSPRIGLSYTLGNVAALFFSYGHFFQIPNYDYLYSNPNWEVSGQAMGNPNLLSEKTVKYELGLQLAVFDGFVVNTNVYYNDVYNLQTIVPIEAYDTRIYPYYTNKDYASTKGISAGIDYRAQSFDFTFNYTLQFAEGNSSDPAENYIAAGQKLDPITKFVPLDWDQMHTFNFAAGYNVRAFGLSLIGRTGSGTRYTFNPPEKSRLALVNIPQNAMTKPQTFYMDLKGYYNLEFLEFAGIIPRLGFYIYNIFDIRNDIEVYDDSGVAGTTYLIEANREVYASSFTTIDEVYADPSMYSSPRYVKLELSFRF